MSQTNKTSNPEGYRVAEVEAWIKENIKSLSPPFEWTKLEGGHSNLTYQLNDSQGRQAVIRRPPQGKLLPKAHDMSREWSLISALGPTPVPVPEAMGFCEDPDVTGAWFYVMSLIDGHVLYNAEDTRRWVPEENRIKLAWSFMDVLSALHAIDPDEVGLGNLGKKENYIGRQLKTWYRSWTSSVEPAQFDDPRAHELQKFLLDNIPEQGPARVVHGDYGLHNCLVKSDGSIAAVVDWEISTLGDPLADLAYSLNQWHDPTDAQPIGPEAPISPPGFPSRTELAKRYSEQTGRDLSKLDYYIGFSRWKSAAITHGVYARYRQGKKSTEGINLDVMQASIESSLSLSQEALKRFSKG